MKSGLYDFVSARDYYREATSTSGVGLHRDMVARYIELQALMIAIIAPHWAEYVWLEILKKVRLPTQPISPYLSHLKSNITTKPETIHKAQFPSVPEVSPELSAALAYTRATSSNITSAEAAFVKKLSKGKQVTFDPRKPKKLSIYAAKKYPQWQEKYIDLVREAFDGLAINDKALNAQVGKLGEMKKAMPFVQALKRRLVVNREAPDTVFERKLPFDEFAVLQEMRGAITRVTGAKALEIIAVDEGGKTGEVLGTGEKREGLFAENAVPGQPSFHFANIE